MKRLFLIFFMLIFTPALVCAGNMGIMSVPLGVMYTTPSVSTNALNTNTTFAAFSFIPSTTKTVNSIRFYASAVTGTLQAGDIAVHIYSTTADGKPDASLASTTTITELPTGAAMVEATGLSLSTTAGTMYWAVITCPNAGSGRYVTLRKFVTVRNEAVVGNSLTFGLNFSSTTDGTAWSNLSQSSGVISVEYSDASISGPLLHSATVSTGTYGTGAAKRHDGFITTMPANARLKIRGAFINVSKVGTPTGNLSATLWVGATPYSSVNAISPAQTTSGTQIFYFDEVEVAPSAVIRITISNSAEDSSANCYKVYSYVSRNNAADLATVPLGIKQTISTDNGSTWTETSENVVLGGVLLDPETMFGVQAGGAGGAYVY